MCKVEFSAKFNADLRAKLPEQTDIHNHANNGDYGRLELSLLQAWDQARQDVTPSSSLSLIQSGQISLLEQRLQRAVDCGDLYRECKKQCPLELHSR